MVQALRRVSDLPGGGRNCHPADVDRRTEHGYGRAEPLNYEVVGGKAIDVVLGKKSGRYSIMLKAYEMGIPMPSEEQASAMLNQIKKISEDNKRLVSEEEFKKIYSQVMGTK